MKSQLALFKKDQRGDDKYLEAPNARFVSTINSFLSAASKVFIDPNTCVTILDYNKARNTAKLALRLVLIITYQMLLFGSSTFDSSIRSSKSLITNINTYIIICSSPKWFAKFIEKINIHASLQDLPTQRLSEIKQNVAGLQAQSYKLSKINASQFIDKRKIADYLKRVEVAFKVKSQRNARGPKMSNTDKYKDERGRYDKVKADLTARKRTQGLTTSKARTATRSNMKNMKMRMNKQQGKNNKDWYGKQGKNTTQFDRFSRKRLQKTSKQNKWDKKQSSQDPQVTKRLEMKRDSNVRKSNDRAVKKVVSNSIQSMKTSNRQQAYLQSNKYKQLDAMNSNKRASYKRKVADQHKATTKRQQQAKLRKMNPKDRSAYKARLRR